MRPIDAKTSARTLKFHHDTITLSAAGGALCLCPANRFVAPTPERVHWGTLVVGLDGPHPGSGRLLWISHLFSRFAPGPRLVTLRQTFVRRCQSIGCSHDVASATCSVHSHRGSSSDSGPCASGAE